MIGVPAIARRPVRYARRSPAPAAVLLFIVLVVLASVRAKRQPTAKEAASLGIAGLVVVLSASVAPELATLALFAAVVASLLNSEPFVLTLATRAQDAFKTLGG